MTLAHKQLNDMETLLVNLVVERETDLRKEKDERVTCRWD